MLPAGQDDAGVPRVDVDLVAGDAPVVRITLHDDGLQPVHYVVTANDYAGGTRSVWVHPGAATSIDWPTSEGYYDIVITADTGSGWEHRYAGRVAQRSA